MAKLSNEKQKNSSFMKKKSLVGLTPELVFDNFNFFCRGRFFVENDAVLSLFFVSLA